MRFCKKNIIFLNVTTTFLYFFPILPKYHIFSFSTTLFPRRQNKSNITLIYKFKKFSPPPWLLMHGFSFWSISEHLNLLQYMYIYIF